MDIVTVTSRDQIFCSDVREIIAEIMGQGGKYCSVCTDSLSGQPPKLAETGHFS